MKISVHDFGHAQMGDAILKRGQLKDVARAALLVRTKRGGGRGEKKAQRGGLLEERRQRKPGQVRQVTPRTVSGRFRGGSARFDGTNREELFWCTRQFL